MLTVTDCAVLPPEPTQVNVKVVFVVRAELFTEPLRA